ncbi:MAG: four helix bundle protein [Candidatus Didemnitutus sp.]|jgi:four helix bundle protein|nr:four helix bundle protein [Candidatus Didemnitutus sp.]
MLIYHFTELDVYRRSSDLAERIFILSKRWPTDERYSLTDQIRRAARSVGANIAESWAKRRYAAHFVSKLTDADGENHEVEHWLLTARRDGYLDSAEFEVLLALKREVGAKLGKMIQSPGPFLLK